MSRAREMRILCRHTIRLTAVFMLNFPEWGWSMGHMHRTVGRAHDIRCQLQYFTVQKCCPSCTTTLTHSSVVLFIRFPRLILATYVNRPSPHDPCALYIQGSWLSTIPFQDVKKIQSDSETGILDSQSNERVLLDCCYLQNSGEWQVPSSGSDPDVL
jgi:hypothetical protein